MTKTEQIELQELGLTEAQIEARAQKLSAMLNDRRNEAAQDAADTPEKAMDLISGRAPFGKVNDPEGWNLVDASSPGRLNAAVPDGYIVNKRGKLQKRRSDAGKPKPTKRAEVQIAPGALLLEQVDMPSNAAEGEMRIHDICTMIGSEVERAMELHAGMHSAHEAYAAIAEELDEFWDLVKINPKKLTTLEQTNRLMEMRKELAQTAAMCVRAISDLDL